MILTKMAASLSKAITTKTTHIPIITASSSTFISKAISTPNPVISPIFGTISKHNRSFSTDDSNNHGGDDSDSSKPDPKKECAAFIFKRTPENYLIHSFKVCEGVRDLGLHPFESKNSAGMYEFKRIKDGIVVRMDFPGMNNENIIISWDRPDLVVKGEAEKECEHDSEGRSYEVRVHFDYPGLYNVTKMVYRIIDGTLTVVIPMMVMDKDE